MASDAENSTPQTDAAERIPRHLRIWVKGQSNHLKCLACSFGGWALEDEMFDREPFEVITARYPSSTRFSTVVNRHLKEDIPDEETFRQTVGYTKEELAPAGVGTMSYLVLGYIHWDRDSQVGSFLDDPNPDAGKGIVGHSRPDNFHPWQFDDEDRPPLLVVTTIPPKSKAGGLFGEKKLFALLNPASGLCTPYEIVAMAKMAIYWRWEFRGNAKNLKGRKDWTQQIISEAVITFQEDGVGALSTEKPVYYDADGNEVDTDLDSNSDGDEIPDDDSEVQEAAMVPFEVDKPASSNPFVDQLLRARRERLKRKAEERPQGVSTSSAGAGKNDHHAIDVDEEVGSLHGTSEILSPVSAGEDTLASEPAAPVSRYPSRIRRQWKDPTALMGRTDKEYKAYEQAITEREQDLIVNEWSLADREKKVRKAERTFDKKLEKAQKEMNEKMQAVEERINQKLEKAAKKKHKKDKKQNATMKQMFALVNALKSVATAEPQEGTNIATKIRSKNNDKSKKKKRHVDSSEDDIRPSKKSRH